MKKKVKTQNITRFAINYTNLVLPTRMWRRFSQLNSLVAYLTKICGGGWSTKKPSVIKFYLRLYAAAAFCKLTLS